MRSLAFLKKQKAEREQRRKEREEKRKEKERQKELEKKQKQKEKKKAASERRKKILKSRKNRRYYNKVRGVELKRRKKLGDVYGYHQVLIMQNNRRIERIGAAWWRTDAYRIYNEAIKENREKVKFPLSFTQTWEMRKSEVQTKRPQKYEIMIVQTLKEGENTVSHLRDKDGRFVENVIVNDKGSHIILVKDDWYVPEYFNVYGYHPSKDRKTFDFILNEIVLKDANRENIRKVFTFNNKLIIQYDLDFDFVVCKDVEQAQLLHDTLEKYAGDNKYIFFTGKLSRGMSTLMLNRLEEKTGWSRAVCKKINSF